MTRERDSEVVGDLFSMLGAFVNALGQTSRRQGLQD